MAASLVCVAWADAEASMASSCEVFAKASLLCSSPDSVDSSRFSSCRISLDSAGTNSGCFVLVFRLIPPATDPMSAALAIVVIAALPQAVAQSVARLKPLRDSPPEMKAFALSTARESAAEISVPLAAPVLVAAAIPLS